MSVVGLAARTGSSAMKLLAGEILKKMIEDTAVLPLMQGKVTGFQKQWKILGLSV